MVRPLLISIPSYEDLARRILAISDVEPAAVERRTFPDGERYPRARAHESVTGRTIAPLLSKWLV